MRQRGVAWHVMFPRRTMETMRQPRRRRCALRLMLSAGAATTLFLILVCSGRTLRCSAAKAASVSTADGLDDFPLDDSHPPPSASSDAERNDDDIPAADIAEGEAPRRRLVSAAVINLALNSILFPEIFAPLVLSARSLYQTVAKPHKKHWSPNMSWDLGPCVLMIDFLDGHKNDLIRKVSVDTFRIHVSRRTGRIVLQWSDRGDSSKMWLKPRLEFSSAPASAWCNVDDSAHYDLFVADGGVEAAVVEFKRLGVNSYRIARFEGDDEFSSLLDSHFVSDAELEAYKEASIPEKIIGWDAERCMFQLIHHGAPKSHIVQWNAESIRGLLRIVDLKNKVVVQNKEIHPLCTYDDGSALKVGEITMKDGRQKIIGFTKPLLTSDLRYSDDLVTVKLRNKETIAADSTSQGDDNKGEEGGEKEQ